MQRKIEMTANVILTFDAKEQMIYDVEFTLTVPDDDATASLDAMEVDVIRQILAPVPVAELQDLVKISLCYAMGATEEGKPLKVLEDARVNALIDHLVRHNAKYYFQPNQRDDYEQRLVDALGIASRTRDFS